MSSDDIAIRVEDVSKRFITYDNPKDRLKQVLIPRIQRAMHRPATRYGHEFWALRNVGFEVARGETVGIVGRNGSGKSTLLQIICGTLMPTAGTVETHGRIAALLELGSGFNPEFTGRENVYLNASVLGLGREEIERRFDSIAAFAGIGDFIEQPVKNYSSGMAVRLAFAVQAQVDPEIMIVDEALAVGDARFQAKCFERLRQLKDNGTSILLVTHSSEQVVTHCSRAVLLDSGQLEMLGEPRKVVNRYMDLLFGRDRKTDRPEGTDDAAASGAGTAISAIGVGLSRDIDVYAGQTHYNPNEYRWGDGAATILDFRIYSDGQAVLQSVASGTEITIDLTVKFNSLVVNPILGFTLKNKEGVTVSSTNSYFLENATIQRAGKNGSVIAARLKFNNFLACGDYFISLGVASRQGEDVVPHDRRYDSIHLVVAPTDAIVGLVDLGLTMEIDTGE
ncbi:MAG: ABC transporter ATP-binding protein [Xanthomonadaceae bacterium]|jgi:lipopolysaccharide transport system ATP-binding protein|nr:ABC transporter ATP-binding protein [Xanthomonadaceae bacterium]